MAIGEAIGAGIGAAAGGIAGLFKDTQDTWSHTVTGARSDLEQNTWGDLTTNYNALTGLVNAGPGASDASASLGASHSLADLLDQYSKTGGLPSSSDVGNANSFASNIFAPQQTALNQSFIQQNTDSQRLAARLGRSVDDPILQAKLRTGFMNQQAMLNSQQGSYASDLALKMPGQRVGYAAQRSDVLGNLASQAFKNRAALLEVGGGLNKAAQDLRFREGTQVGYNSTGGGAGNAIAGGIAGAGAGLTAASLFGSGGSGGVSSNFGVNLSGSNSDVFGTSFGQSAPGGGGGAKTYSLGM